MFLTRFLARLRLDPYIAALFSAVILASLLPCRNLGAVVMGDATKLAIALLFFLYGARLSTEAVIAGITQWRLQILILICTFALFPLLGLGLAAIMRPWLGGPLAAGLIFLSVLPSTVQSSIAFTSIARGNVAAALCSASASNLLGIAISPILVGLLLSTHGSGFSGAAIRDIVLQLFVPFAAGQAVRAWSDDRLRRWLETNRKLIGITDRGSILLVVYTAFSDSVVNGLWDRIDTGTLALLGTVCALLLFVVLTVTTQLSRRLGFNRADEIAIVFCGSKKSLASGIPMATILFTGHDFGMVVLPLMLFHQIQLFVCAILAKRYAAQAPQFSPAA